MIDPKPIGEVTMGLIERIEEQFGEDAELMTVVVAAEVKYTDEDGDSCFSYQWNDKSLSLAAQRGVVEYMRDGLRAGR